MQEPVSLSVPSSSRLMDALICVSADVTKAIIQKARQTQTPVIITDDQGNILRLDAEELAKQYGL
jgi:fructose/tagatose bisphosphate aldolase